MDPFDAPEPVALLQSSLDSKSLSRPTLVPDVAAYVPPSLPAELEEAFFDTLPPPPERSASEWDEDEIVPRRRWGERLFVGALGLLLVGALGAAGWALLNPGLESVTYPEDEVIGEVAQGESREAQRSVRRARRAKSRRASVRAAVAPSKSPASTRALPPAEAPTPLRASDLTPAMSVSALPPAD